MENRVRQRVGRLAYIAPAAIFAVDLLFERAPPPLVVTALLDESAHLATTAVFLGALRPRVARPFVWSTLLSAVLIDVDHLPRLVAQRRLSKEPRRPSSHSLLIVGIVLFGLPWLAGARRQAAYGAAFGLATHFIRDLASPTGVPLFWPIASRSIRLPYSCYAALLLLAAGVIERRTRRPDADAR